MRQIQNRSDFEEVYNLDDPRPYFQGVHAADYRMPGVVCNYLLGTAARLADGRQKTKATILDFAGGYGVNGALLNHDISLPAFYRRYLGSLDDAGSQASSDQAFFKALRRKETPYEVLGLDIADRALGYAYDMGFYQDVFVENLVTDQPGPSLSAAMQRVDLIVETGAIGATLPVAFQRLVKAAGKGAPWILMASRPDVDDGPLNQVLATLGYGIEKCNARPIAYRRFMGPEEKQSILAKTKELGRDADFSFKDDYFWVDLLLARPDGATGRYPLLPWGEDLSDL